MPRVCRQVFEAFLAAPGRTLTTAELLQPSVGGGRFSARIFELTREYGCVFEKRQVRRGSWRYTLASWPAEVGADPVPGVDPGGASLRRVDETQAVTSSGSPDAPDPGEALPLFETRELAGHDQEAA